MCDTTVIRSLKEVLSRSILTYFWNIFTVWDELSPKGLESKGAAPVLAKPRPNSALGCLRNELLWPPVPSLLPCSRAQCMSLPSLSWFLDLIQTLDFCPLETPVLPLKP